MFHQHTKHQWRSGLSQNRMHSIILWPYFLGPHAPFSDRYQGFTGKATNHMEQFFITIFGTNELTMLVSRLRLWKCSFWGSAPPAYFGPANNSIGHPPPVTVTVENFQWIGGLSPNFPPNFMMPWYIFFRRSPLDLHLPIPISPPRQSLQKVYKTPLKYVMKARNLVQ
jgi:hypothetical protein